MQSTAHDFKDNVGTALADPNLQDSLAKLKVGFSERRRQAAERLPEFETLRDRARDIKNHALANLDFYLEEFERKVIAKETWLGLALVLGGIALCVHSKNQTV